MYRRCSSCSLQCEVQMLKAWKWFQFFTITVNSVICYYFFHLNYTIFVFLFFMLSFLFVHVPRFCIPFWRFTWIVVVMTILFSRDGIAFNVMMLNNTELSCSTLFVYTKNLVPYECAMLMSESLVKFVNPAYNFLLLYYLGWWCSSGLWCSVES